MSELEFIYRVVSNIREVHARTGGLQGVSPVESENHSR